MLHDFIYFEIPLKYGFFSALGQLLVPFDTLPPAGGSRKLFIRNSDGKLDFDFPGT